MWHRPQTVKFQRDEIAYFVNLANLVGLTLQNVRLFEQVATAQQQWVYTFDSIGDPILVHRPGISDPAEQSAAGPSSRPRKRRPGGRAVSELLPRKGRRTTRTARTAKGSPEKATSPIRGCRDTFWPPIRRLPIRKGRQLGTVHVLKDITDRKRAEEKYRTLVSNVQEGVFISTPQGRFLDFNDALMRILGYENREELLGVDIPRPVRQSVRIASG